MGVAALRRGYHVLLHDGPGQGRPLIDEGLPLRHDWEKVVTPVVDAALAIDVVDPDRIVYESCSLGGYFAPRVAAYEHRIAAAVADPGQLDVGVKFFEMMQKLGLGDDAAARLPAIDPDDEQKVMAAVETSRPVRWKIVQRGFWTNGAPDLASYLVEMDKWRLSPDEVASIRCPTLVAAAESDPVVVERQGPLRRSHLPEDVRRVHGRRRRWDALRTAQPLAREPRVPRLARRHARYVRAIGASFGASSAPIFWNRSFAGFDGRLGSGSSK